MDLLNELQYRFGTQDALEGNAVANPGTGKIEPTLVQRMLGVDSQMLETAANTGKFNRFGSTQQGQDAKRYGVTVTRDDMSNLGGLQDRIDTAKSLRTNREVLTGLGYTGDVNAYTTLGGIAGAIRTQKEKNDRESITTAQSLAFNDPTARDERAVRDRRYYDQQKANLQERIDAREDRKLEFEYQKLRDRKADMQYNERLEQLDRKDRKMAMQNLAAGLASLGAAFAM